MMNKQRTFSGVLILLFLAALNTSVFIKPAKAVKEKDWTYGWHFMQCPDGTFVVRCEDNPSGDKCYVWSQALCSDN